MKWVITFALVLLASVALQFTGKPSGKIDHPDPNLRAMLAVDPDGWVAKDLPLGETESMQTAVASTLRYDDYLFRRYSRGSIEFTVYVAYWRPGKHPPQMITQHTPDRCWTMNGMTCEEMRHNVSAKVENADLRPGQWRKFRTPAGAIIYTMFWHLVGDRLYDFGERFYATPGPLVFWAESLRFAVGTPKAQMFFRVTSNVPFEQIWNEPGVQRAIRGFTVLGLREPRL